jgi:hypothetical protein
MLVARARRRVHHEIVELARGRVVPSGPVDVFEELLDELVLFGATPDDGSRGGGEEEADGDTGEVGGDVDWGPAGGGGVKGFVLEAEEERQDK